MHTVVVLATAATLAASAVGAAAGETPRITAGRLAGTLRVDGVLDEASWQRAEVMPDLVQQTPHPFEPTPYRTEVRLLVDDDTLYLGVRCFDPEPGKIAIHTLQRDGVVIPAGRHRFDRYEIEAGTSSHRTWQVSTELGFGTFYTGTMRQWAQSVAYNSPGGRLQLELELENVWGHLPEGDFTERLLSLKSSYCFSPELVLSAYAQVDTDSRHVGVNTRLRWTVTPGTDLYVVWDHGWQRPFGEDSWRVLKPVSDQAIVKLRYTWRPQGSGS